MYTMRQLVKREGCRMAFSPNKCSVHGGQCILIAFPDNQPLSADAQFYLTFHGSVLRQAPATLIGPATLQAPIPAYPLAEEVQVTVVQSQAGVQRVLPCGRFTYLADSATDLARYLVDSVYDPMALDRLENIKSETFQLITEDFATLDARLTAAIQEIRLPAGWHLMGLDCTLPAPPPRENLLHFCARLGLLQLTRWLLQLPGASHCLLQPNTAGQIPVNIARAKHNSAMISLLEPGSGQRERHAWNSPPLHSTTASGVRGQFEGSVSSQPQVRGQSQGSVSSQPPVRGQSEGSTSSQPQVRRAMSEDSSQLMKMKIATAPPESQTQLTDTGPPPGPPPGPSPGPPPQRPPRTYRARHRSDVLRREQVIDTDSEDDDEAFLAAGQPGGQPGGHGGQHGGQRGYTSSESDQPRPGGQSQQSSQTSSVSGPRYKRNSSTRRHSYHQRRYQRHQQTSSGSLSGSGRTHSAGTPSTGHSTSGSPPPTPLSAPPSFTNIPVSQIPQQAISRPEPHYEDSLRRLKEIHDGIHRLRELNTSQSSHQSARKQTLQRFSSSCPSLADQLQPAPSHNLMPALNATDHYKSMLELAEDKSSSVIGQEREDHSPAGTSTPHSHATPSASAADTDIRICINDVTVDSTDDYATPDALNPELLIENLKKNKRRSSWCPEEGRKREEKQEKQKMLGISGRSQSLSSLDGQDDDSDDTDEDDDSSTASSYHDTSQDSHTIATPPTSRNSSTTAGYLSVADYGNSPLHPTANSTPNSEMRKALGASNLSSSGGSTSPSSPRAVLYQRSEVTGVQGQSQLPDGIVTMPAYDHSMFNPEDVCAVSNKLGSGAAGSLTVPTSSLQKSISTPAISKNSKTTGKEKRPSSISEGTTNDSPDSSSQHSHMVIQQLIADHDAAVAKSHAPPTEQDNPTEDERLQRFLRSERGQGRLSMIEFLTEYGKSPSLLEDDDRPKQVKEEKKRRSSVFSKLGSYRQKKVAKDFRLSKNMHQFMSVSFSNSTACDVCGRSMANKAALQCENCMVNVHESSCKDQIAPCAKHPQPKLQRRDSWKEKNKSNSLPAAPITSVTDFGSNNIHSGTNLKGSQSFKERRTTSVPPRPLQVSQSVSVLQKPGVTGANGTPSLTSSGYFQWRRVATKLGIDKVINEEQEKGVVKEKEEDYVSLSHKEIHLGDGTSISDAMSVSMESLDEGGAEVNFLDDDPDLMLHANEPEAWSVTVDKKTLKKMSAKDIKRQDHIWEFIQTERSHCTTLKIMQRVFSHGMLRELNFSKDMIDRIFPKLDHLIEIHLSFVRRLMERQRIRLDRSIDNFADILVQQFQGEIGERMKVAYGEFCSRHSEAVQLYKDILKSDRKFQNFIKKCSRNNLCKRLSIPECILLVTQRITKYPLLIEPIIKVTKDNREERDLLVQALTLTRQVLDYVDAQIDAHAKEERLIEIYNKLDARSSAVFKGKKFKKSDLLSNNRKLIHEGYIRWMSARGKPFEVLAVILSDLVFFLSENAQKYTFFSQDNKSSVISLSKLLVREKGDTRDSKGVYLICQSKTEPEMYELVCKSAEGRKSWIQTIRAAIAKCPEEFDQAPSESEEERKLQEARSARLRQLMDQLYQKDQTIQHCCEEKNKIVVDMLEIFGKEEVMNSLKSLYRDEESQELLEPDELLQAVLSEASQLTTLLQATSLSHSALSCSNSSVGDDAPSPTPPLPKRAETFSGFEGKEKVVQVKKRHTSSFNDADRCNSLTNLAHRDDSLLSVETPPRTVATRRGSIGVASIVQENLKAANKEKFNRRMSTSFLQNLLTKQHNDKDDSDSPSRGSDRSPDVSGLHSPTLLPLTPPSKEQCACVAQLLHYVQGLVTVTARQGSEVECFRAQLAEANSKVTNLYAETERLAHDKKHGYHHDKQLEELRNLQESIHQERSELERLKNKQLWNLEVQQNEIKQSQSELEKQKVEMKAQKEELQRQREALQRQIDLFELHKLKSQTDSPTLRARVLREGSESPTQTRATSAKPQIVMDNVVHKRSASDDLVNLRAAGTTVSASSTDSAGREQAHSHTSTAAVSNKDPSKKEGRQRPHSASSTRTSSMNLGNVSAASQPLRDKPVPIQLLSATNEQKMGSVTQQTLPFKLASSGSSSSLANSNKPSQQVVPSKVTASSPGNPASPPVPPRHSARTGSTSSAQTSPTDPHSRLHCSKSQPNVLSSSQHSRLSSSSSSNLLPMKLAQGKSQQRPTSASVSGSSSQDSVKKVSTHSPRTSSSSSTSTTPTPTKKEPKVIYF